MAGFYRKLFRYCELRCKMGPALCAFRDSVCISAASDLRFCQQTFGYNCNRLLSIDGNLISHMICPAIRKASLIVYKTLAGTHRTIRIYAIRPVIQSVSVWRTMEMYSIIWKLPMFVSVSNYIGNIFRPLKVHSDGITRSKNNRGKRLCRHSAHGRGGSYCVCVSARASIYHSVMHQRA